MAESHHPNPYEASNRAEHVASEDQLCSTGSSPARDRLARFYRDYSKELASKLRSMFGDGPPDPDDVAQEAFHRLIGRADSDSIQNLKAFVWRTARNILVSEKRHQAMRSRHDYEVEQLYFAMTGFESSSENVIIARDQLNLIETALKKMPAVRRRAFVLNRVEGLSIADVGRALGMTGPGAAKHIARGTADIEAAINPYPED